MIAEKPLVSIIMGAYNCEKTIDRCILSIVKQSYTNFEFIICDDCSTDNTLESLKRWESKDDRIIILHNKVNCRLAASLNNCLSVAKGKYIARMDADDCSTIHRIEQQVLFLETHPEYDVVGCNRYILSNGKIIGKRKSEEYPTKEMLLLHSPFAHPTILMKKEVYDNLGGYSSEKSTMRAEDLDLWFRFFERGFKGYNIQKCYYIYSESLTDYEKRSIKAAFYTTCVYLKGYKMIGIPWYKWCYAIKPMISAILPNKIMFIYHNRIGK